jgi:hypothetical protein
MNTEEPKSLVMTGGVHTIRIDLFEDFRKEKVCRITCIDDDTCTQDINDEWIEETTEGCFYASIEGIDKIIEKLNEAKTYLTDGK